MGSPEFPAEVEVLRRVVMEGFATGNTDVVDELCSLDFVEHQANLAASGQEAIAGLKRAIQEVHASMPDIVYTLEDWAVRGDVAWVRFRSRGTQTGPFFGPPAGAPIDITVMDAARVVDGRMVEHWGVPDRFSILQQSGVLRRWISSERAAAVAQESPD